MNKPLIFISYASDELEIADFVKKVLLRVSDNKIEVFVAKRDISSGADPLKTMLNERLKKADAIIPICSYKSKESPWLWWESASVWATTGRVHPIFTNISANIFDGPLTLVVQGKEFFAKQEFFQTMEMLCRNLEISPTQLDFTPEEATKYLELGEIYSKPKPLADVRVSYEILEQTQPYHKYSLEFEARNKNASAFEDIILELFFPTKYLIKKEWTFPFLRSSFPEDEEEYTCLTFIFDNMPESGKRQFSQFLLPGKTLKIFGVDGITKLEYEMDAHRSRDKEKYKVSYNLYINRGTPQKGSINFPDLQFF